MTAAMLAHVCSGAVAAPPSVALGGTSEVITVDIRSRVTFDPSRVVIRARSTTAVTLKRQGGSPQAGVAVIPELGITTNVVLADARSLPAGRYEITLSSRQHVTVSLPIPQAVFRVVRRRPLPLPTLSTANLMGPAATPFGRWQHDTTLRAATLVIAAASAEFTAAAGVDTIDICVVEIPAPCSAQEGHGISYVNTRVAGTVSETVDIVYVDFPDTTGKRSVVAQVAAADTVKSAAALAWVARLT